VLDDVAEGRGLIGEGTRARKRTKPAPTEANRVYATLHLFYEWLHKEWQEWLGVTAHPLAGLDKPSPERVRTRTYSNQEIRALLSAVRGTELEAYPDLTPAQIHAALAYYYDNREEIDAELAADKSWAESLDR